MNRYNALAVVLVILLAADVVSAQTTTNSIYSRYGVGIIRPQSFSQNFALGGAAIALKSQRNINSINPASFSAIALTTFEVGFTNNALWMNDGTQSQYKNNPHINSIALAFPVINQKWGISLGLMPVTSIGYNFTAITQNELVGTTTSINKGNGGLNKFYFGNGVSLKIDSSSSISFGANGSYYFGQSSLDQKFIFGNLTNGLNVWNLTETNTSDVSADFGTQYQKTITRKDSSGNYTNYIFTVGGIFSLNKDLNTNYNQLQRTFIGSADFGTIKDTISIIKDQETTTEIPLEYGIGFSLEYPNHWLIALDYRTADWSTINSSSTIFTYKKVHSVALGSEYIPNYNDYTGKLSYFNRISYRMGFRYATSNISINNVDFNEYGITFGLGLPLRRTGTSLPIINLGLEFGKRGKKESNLIEEKFVNFNVGIIINDKWFQKRKYN